MRILSNLSALAVRQLVGGACHAAGVGHAAEGAEQVVGFLTRHFTDHSRRLTRALEETNDRAWKALEVALAGDSLWDRARLALASGDDRAFREQVRPFLDACPLAELHGRDAYRRSCLEQLCAARKAGLLSGGGLDPAALARKAGALARFGDPDGLLAAEVEALAEMGDDLRQAGHADLAAFVALRPQRGEPLLAVAARYFFRRAVEEDAALFQGLAFAKLEQLQEGQDAAFRGLERLLGEQGARLEQLLGGVQATVAATHDAVLDVREEQRRQGEQGRDIYQAVVDLQGRFDLMHRELRPRDSLSIRNDGERALVKHLVARYRALGEDQRRGMPALLNAIGKLEVAAGDFQAAGRDFAAVAGLVADPAAQAEAHANAYHAALERRDWDAALAQLRDAVRLGGPACAPFPLDKYPPQRILGAGGFGVAFLCRHRFLKADVVVKTLRGEEIDRGVDEVFAEAQALRQIDHPAIIRLQDCGFAGDDDSRPYLVMDYFDGPTLEEHAKAQPLAAAELVEVARQVASALHAAHGQGILHRDVKPANLLVRRPQDGAVWQVKLIDFGLALRRAGGDTLPVTTATLKGSSIAGTLDYGAPEQMGRLAGVAVGPASDVYGFGRTCCYALFGTPQPLPRHWRSVPEPLAELLEHCLEEKPDQRPAGFGPVLERLAALAPGGAAPPRPAVSLPVAAPPPPAPESTVPASALSPEQRRQELDALARRVAGCTRCAPLAAARRQTVPGAGPLDAEVMFLGEAPGADEDASGQPFVGQSGQLLDRILAAAGLPRQDVFLANLLKCRPPNNRTPLPGELANCREYLDRQIELVRPKILCAMGGTAAQSLLRSAESIGRLRGRFQDYKGIPVLCTYHPAFLLPTRSPEKIRDVWEDVCMLLRRLGRPVPREMPFPVPPPSSRGRGYGGGRSRY